jgi:prophage regulatory protein
MRPENLPERILRLKELRQVVGLSRSTIYELIKRGEFPKPIHLSTRTSGWLWTDINEWLGKKERGVRRLEALRGN